MRMLFATKNTKITIKRLITPGTWKFIKIKMMIHEAVKFRKLPALHFFEKAGL